MRIQRRINSIDRRIITLLEAKPKLTQSEIALELGISQSSIAQHLKTLKGSGLLVSPSGVDYQQLGMFMGRVDVDTTNERNVLEWAENCPLFVNAAKGVGQYGLLLFFATEDYETFHYLVDEHLRKIVGVKGVEFKPIRCWERPFSVRLDLHCAREKNPPCAMIPYCPKCPSNPEYDGRVWNENDKLLQTISETR